MVLGSEKGSVKPGWTTPERKAAVGYSPVELGRDLEAVVPVLLGVVKETRDLVPDGTPRRTGKTKPGGKA
jgi:hypothetical protein